MKAWQCWSFGLSNSLTSDYNLTARNWQRHRSSVVEQTFRKRPAVSSILTGGFSICPRKCTFYFGELVHKIYTIYMGTPFT